MLYAFHGTIETEKTHAYLLAGLNPSGRYQLRFYDHSAPDRIVAGQELAKQGLKVTLPLPNSSEIVFIEAAK